MYVMHRCRVWFLLSLVFVFTVGCPDSTNQTDDPNSTGDPNSLDPNNADTNDDFIDENADPIEARSGHTLTFVDDAVYLFGGQGAPVEVEKAMNPAKTSAGPFFNDLWRFNIDLSEYEKVKSTGDGPAARSGHSAVVYNGKLHVMGGIASAGDVYRDAWRYDSQTNLWTKVSEGGPTLTDHSAAIVGDRMIVIGGNDGTSNRRETWIYDFVSGTWSQGADYPATHDLVKPPVYVADGKLHVVGTSDGAVYLYDVAANTWQTKLVSGVGPGQLSGAAFCQTQAGLAIMGGADSSGLSAKTWMYSPANFSYTQGADLPVPLYNAAASILSADGITGVIFGGLTSNGQYSADTYKYQYSSSSRNLSFQKLSGN